MSINARNRRVFAAKAVTVICLIAITSVAAAAAFGPQSLSLGRLLTPFIGAAAPTQAFKEVEPQLHAEPPAPVSMPSGTLATARSGHTATVLADGRVLIVGGSGDTSAEIFDPANGTASAANNTTYARTGHTATRLSDGRVLIAGGGNVTSEIYDPATGTFSLGPQMATSRSGHTATAVGNSVIFTGGGTDSVEVFDGNGFTAAGSLTAARTNHSAVAMNDGRVFIAGGDGLDTAEIYNPADGTSVATGNPLAHQRSRAHLRVLPDGKVQIIGGNDDVSMEVYDPAIDTVGAHVHLLPDTDTCTGLRTGVRDSQTRAALFFAGNADAAYDRTGHTITEVSGNQALVIGGTTGGSATNAVTSFASSPATITTDKLDYAPGETVTFSGTGFAPGETVRVVIHEDPHTHLERNFEATADASGNITGSYQVEEHDLGVNFIANARGLTSNLTAQTAFTDGGVNVRTDGTGGVNSNVDWVRYSTANCSGAALGSGSIVSTTGGNGTAIPGGTSTGQSLLLTANAPSGFAFSNWSNDVPGSPNASNPLCVPDENGTRQIRVNYIGAIATTLTLAAPNPASVQFGSTGPVTLSATLTRTTGGAAVSGATINFTVDTVSVGTAVTNASGVASITTYDPSALSVGPHTVQSSFAGATISSVTYTGGTSGTETLAVTKADQTIIFGTLVNKTYGDAPFGVSATGGASGNPVTFASQTTGVCTTGGVNGSDVTIVAAGLCTIRASQAGNTNYNAATNVDQSFTVNTRNLTITANDRTKTYGDVLALGTAAFTTSGNEVSGETVTSVTLTSTGGLAGSATTAAGEYPGNIVPSAATGSGGFPLT